MIVNSSSCISLIIRHIRDKVIVCYYVDDEGTESVSGKVLALNRLDVEKLEGKEGANLLEVDGVYGSIIDFGPEL